MKSFIQRLRSFCFDTALYSFGAIYLFILLPFLFMSPLGFGPKILQGLMRSFLFFARILVGLSYQVKGVEHLRDTLKQGPCLVACKHQSAWETIALATFFESFTFVLKKELGNVPLFGLYLKKTQMIFIDRQAGRQSIKDLLTQARHAIQNKRSVLIFPEGTRTLPDEPSTYQSGIGLLYRDLNVPVLPVALNSGLFWRRRSWIKKPGKIIIEFLPPIAPGLSRENFMRRLQQDIESACEKLLEVRL